jgi:hypothetical protein
MVRETANDYSAATSSRVVTRSGCAIAVDDLPKSGVRGTSGKEE